jgi:hypothetical protein
MIQDIKNLMDAYYAWLKDKTALRQIDQWIEITTPYLDRNNDYIQIYAKKANGGFILTDDGYTIDDLETGGCKLESRKRQDLLKMTLNGFRGPRIARKFLPAQAQSRAGNAGGERYILSGRAYGGKFVLRGCCRLARRA